MRTRHFPGSNLPFDFGSQSVSDYVAETPVLDFREFLNGRLSASGVFFGLSGRVERHFTLDMTGDWSGGRGTLDEKFRYNDGETGERRWSLTFTGEGAFTATAPDVEGEAVGAQCGNAAVMRYRLRIPRAKGEIIVGMEDWFYLMEDGTLINRARMSKFGFKVGELLASFRKRDGDKISAGRAGPE